MNRAMGTSYRGSTFSERMALAPCRDTDPDLSFPAKSDGGEGRAKQYARAKAVCATCPLWIQQECLELALKTEGNAAADLRYGVFAGLTPHERNAIAKGRIAAAADVARADEIIRNRQHRETA